MYGTIYVMSKQKVLFVSFLFLLMIGGVVLYRSLRMPTEKCDPFITTQDCQQISLATSTWKVFENTKYGYAISFPSESSISTSNDYADDLRTEEDIGFYLPGRFPLIGVDATIYPNPPSFEAADELDLKSYAESVRTLQVNFPNPNHKDRNVGELTGTIIDGREAYWFTLDQGFTTEKKIGRGYSIPPGQTYMYTITENSMGQKIIIYYLLGNPVAETMFQTFEFR